MGTENQDGKAKRIYDEFGEGHGHETPEQAEGRVTSLINETFELKRGDVKFFTLKGKKGRMLVFLGIVPKEGVLVKEVGRGMPVILLFGAIEGICWTEPAPEPTNPAGAAALPVPEAPLKDVRGRRA